MASSEVIIGEYGAANLAISNIDQKIHDIHEEASHVSALFPEDTDETVTLTAGGGNNAFGAWAELVDNNAVKLSSKYDSRDMHISEISITSTDTNDKRWILEVSYGAAKVVHARLAFGSGNKFIATEQTGHFKAPELPTDELIYWRMKCETAGAICTIVIRYHLHVSE